MATSTYTPIATENVVITKLKGLWKTNDKKTAPLEESSRKPRLENVQKKNKCPENEVITKLKGHWKTRDRKRSVGRKKAKNFA